MNFPSGTSIANKVVGERADSSMIPVSLNSEGELQSIEGLMAWFHRSSSELIQEYRRLEERVARLNRELERKNVELEQSLREREEARSYLLSILESVNAGVLVTDTELDPTLINRRLQEIVGAVDGVRVEELFGSKLAFCLKQGQSGLLPFECERSLKNPSGKTTPVHLTVSEITVENGEKRGFVLVAQDTSRIKRLEAEAARSQRLASLGEMAAEMAHQIRNPLGGIELYASLLKEKGEGESRRLGEEIHAGVHRLYTTISHLLSFAAEPTVEAELLSVSTIAREVRELAATLLSDGRWQLEINIGAGVPPVLGDVRLLAEGLYNLVANGAEAMPKGGRIEIVFALSPFYTVNGKFHRYVEIRIADHGGGIPQENRERIFDPFFTSKAEGTGLGLAFAHKIISAHGGFIEIDSHPAGGAQFAGFLPGAEENGICNTVS